jgi:hypothetical protein
VSPRAAEYLIIIVIYLIATVLYLRPMLASLTRRLVFFWADPTLVAYLIAWNQHSFMTYPRQILSPNFLYPTAHALGLSDTLLAPALLALPLAAFQNPLLVYNVLFFASSFLSALLWYVVLRGWGLVTLAAFAGGLAFGFLPWRLGQLGHAQLLYTWWIPIAVGSATSWIRSGGWRPLTCLGLSLGAQFYTSVYNSLFLVLYVSALVAAGLLALRPAPRVVVERVGQYAVGLALFAIILIPSLPAYLDMKREIGPAATIRSIARRGAAPADYARPHSLNYLWGRTGLAIPNSYSDVPWEHSLFFGFGTMSL